MKIKSYPKRNSLFIKEQVEIYVREFGSGVFYVMKNRDGDYDHFITTKELVEKFNSANKVAVESENRVELYCHYQDHFDRLVSLIDAHENSFKYRRENKLGC